MKPVVLGSALAVAATLALGRLAAQDATRFADAAAQNVFVRSRAVVVHSGSVTQLRSLVMKGRIRFGLEGGGLIDGLVEYRILLPDHFLRIETVGATERRSGFAASALLTEMRERNRVELPPQNMTSALLRLVHAHFTRLMLGAMTYVTADQQLTFRSSGGAVAMVDPRDSAAAATASNDPRQQAGGSTVITNATPDMFSLDVMSETFAARLVVGNVSREPAKLVYMGANKTPTAMTFGDRHPVSGFDLPYRITTTAGDRVLETITFDEILVNPELTRADFSR